MLSKNKPSKDAKISLIQINNANCHWMMAVWKQNGREVTFYYADNLYDAKVELEVTRLLSSAAGSLKWFFPGETKWIVCPSMMHLQHGYEYGARVMIEGTIMALHTHPNQNMLRDISNENLGEYSRQL